MDRLALGVYNADGTPRTNAVVSFVDYCDQGGTPRAQPNGGVIPHLGDGLFGFQPSDADAIAGTIALVSTDGYPRRKAFAICLEQNAFGVGFLENPVDGTLWAGAAASVVKGRDFTGAVALPTLQVVRSPYLYAVLPTALQLAAGLAWRFDAPAGAAPLHYDGSLFPPSTFSASSELIPAHDLATFLAGALTLPSPPGGSVTLTYGAGGNLTRGPMRFVDETVKNLAVNVLQTGGPARMPFLGEGTNWVVARVQVSVRSSMDNFEQGEAVVAGLLRKSHTANVAGYTNVYVQESVANYLGAEERGVHVWTFNVEMRFKV